MATTRAPAHPSITVGHSRSCALFGPQWPPLALRRTPRPTCWPPLALRCNLQSRLPLKLMRLSRPTTPHSSAYLLASYLAGSCSPALHSRPPRPLLRSRDTQLPLHGSLLRSPCSLAFLSRPLRSQLRIQKARAQFARLITLVFV